MSNSDISLLPSRVYKNPGPEYGDSARIWQGIPGIERAANGRLWTLWYSGGTDEGPGNFVVLYTSADDGETWTGPKLVIDPGAPLRAFDPVLWHDPNGRLWLFWAQSEGLFDGRAGVWSICTEDSSVENPKWSEPARICDGIMMNKPTVLSSGEWLLPAAVWASMPNTMHDMGDKKGSLVVASTDNGKTWQNRGKAVIPDSTFDEHMVVERRDKTLWMLVRTSYGIGESTSADRGQTWAPGKPSAIQHVDSRFHIRRMLSGRLLLVKHTPPSMQVRSHLTAYLSEDDGLTWTGGLLLDERAGVSYPDGIQSSDGVIRIIYDYNRQTDRQILMARFTEDDVLAAKPVSSACRLQMLINQACSSAQL